MFDKETIIKGCENWVNNHKNENYLLTYSSVVELLAILKEQNGLLEQSNAANEYLSTEVERLNGLLKTQKPKPPIHIHKEYPKHDWETDKDGDIDEWAWDYEYHNGPVCKRCGYGFCVDCKPNGWNDKPCVIDYYQCPNCGKKMYKGFENIMYCDKCGQAVKWE